MQSHGGQTANTGTERRATEGKLHRHCQAPTGNDTRVEDLSPHPQTAGSKCMTRHRTRSSRPPRITAHHHAAPEEKREKKNLQVRVKDEKAGVEMRFPNQSQPERRNNSLSSASHQMSGQNREKHLVRRANQGRRTGDGRFSERIKRVR